MKRTLISLALIVLLMVSIPVSAFASAEFNRSIFNGRDDLSLTADDMTGITYVRSSGWADGKTIVTSSASAVILVSPFISLTDPADFYVFEFDYHGYHWADLNSILIKIGDNRYIFSNCNHSYSLGSDGTVFENISFDLTNQMLSFMDDLIQHQNDEIKIRLQGTTQSFDFTLTDEMKNEILTLYDVYVNGGGIRKSNLDGISLVEKTVVTKNGYPLK